MNQTKEMPIVPIVTGEVFKQDKIVSETHCYICKKEFNKFDDKDMLLLRVKEHEMGFCCPHHTGIVQEFIRQFRTMPGGWEKHTENSAGSKVDEPGGTLVTAAPAKPTKEAKDGSKRISKRI